MTSCRDRNSIVPFLFHRLLARAANAVLVHFWAPYLNGRVFVFCFLFDHYYSLTILYLRIGILCLSLKKCYALPFTVFQAGCIWNEVLKEFVSFSTFLGLKAHLQIPQLEVPLV